MKEIRYLGKSKSEFICNYCGSLCVKNKYDVKKGKVKSCGCLLKSKELKNLEGYRYNNLTAVKNLGKKNNQTYYLFKCDCGKEIERMAKEVKRGKLKSCGCMISENVKKANTTHGKTNTNIYKRYRSMLFRCYNKNCKQYSNYGGRRINVCDLWKGENGFLNFEKWANESGYKKELTLERIDVNGNYEPSNCKWITLKEQRSNRRITLKYEYNGETKTLIEWAAIFSIRYDTLWRRIKMYNYSFEEAIKRG